MTETGQSLLDEAFCKGCDDWARDTVVCGDCGDAVCPDHLKPSAHGCDELSRKERAAR